MATRKSTKKATHKNAFVKRKTVKRKKVKKIAPMAIPKDLRPFVIRKFKSKDHTKRFVVVRLPKDEGYRVVALHKGIQTVVRTFDVPTASEVPVPVWLSVQRQTSAWYAGHIARKAQPPSQRQERSRRKRYIKKAMANWNAHLETKAAVRVARGESKIVPPTQPLKSAVPYICIYDPKANSNVKKPRTTFTLHMANCGRLDQERKRAILKHDGDSWIIEANSPEQAIQLQLKEFEADDMGYDISDFSVHASGCVRIEKRVKGKTVLGRVSNKAMRGRRS